MCGIAGFINFKKDISKDNFILEQMINTLDNRGPNEEGSYISSNALLAHKRLVVVDPIGGTQPMIKIKDNNEFILVYNGELYNTEKIRNELLSQGFTFDSYSDTEVLLTSYICWGINCVKKFNGIFSFAIYDKKLKRLFLARDAMGVKPLFYAYKDNTFIFASEIKSILKHPLIKSSITLEGLTELFALGPAVKPGSAIFKDIKEIPPANYLIVSNDNILLKEYWHLEARENEEDLDSIINHTRNILIDAIKRQLISDVPLCTFLSGGLDSSIISAIAAKEFSKNNEVLTTFSIDYENNDKYFTSSFFQPTSDEHFAIKMSKYLNTNHKTISLNHTDLVNSLKDSTIARDLPGMADVDSSLLLFCKEIKKNFVVGLSGECADELFGGYPWFTTPELKWADTFPWSRFIDNRISILNNDLKNLKIKDYAQNEYESTLKEVPHLPGESKEDFRMRELFYLNMRWFMITLLTRKDRMSMANSLEVRVPFADYKLVEYAFNIPSSIKLFHGREKGLLRKCFEDILPNYIVYRKKSPYPKTHNPIYTTLVCNEMNKILNDKTSPILPLIDEDIVREIVSTGGSSYTTPWYGQLMTGPQLIAYLIQINIWLKEYSISII